MKPMLLALAIPLLAYAATPTALAGSLSHRAEGQVAQGVPGAPVSELCGIDPQEKPGAFVCAGPGVGAANGAAVAGASIGSGAGGGGGGTAGAPTAAPATPPSGAPAVGPSGLAPIATGLNGASQQPVIVAAGEPEATLLAALGLIPFAVYLHRRRGRGER